VQNRAIEGGVHGIAAMGRLRMFAEAVCRSKAARIAVLRASALG
jgi:hypothetical protein